MSRHPPPKIMAIFARHNKIVNVNDSSPVPMMVNPAVNNNAATKVFIIYPFYNAILNKPQVNLLETLNF